MPPFVVFALPRSRTKWVSTFLTHGAWHCGHDELRHCRSLDDVASWFAQPMSGTVETAAAPFWRLLERYAPGCRVVTIRRPVADVVASLARVGMVPDGAEAVVTRFMRRLDAKLDQIEARLPGVMSVRYEDLANEATCARLFEHCLGMPRDSKWWAACDKVNIQVDMRHVMRHFLAYRPQLEKLAEIARREMLTRVGPRKVVDRDDVTIQEETCEAWFRDGTRLFEEHAIKLGEAPDGYLTKNWRLMHLMSDLGAMQIITARCNGRMVGYYVCYIGPATDQIDLKSALQISIFVSDDFKGLATRLHRASLAALREKGVGEVNFRAGVKADGARMAVLYKRAGAEHIGQMFRLPLKAVA